MNYIYCWKHLTFTYFLFKKLLKQSINVDTILLLTGISHWDIWSRHEEAARLLSMRALSADKYLGTVLFGTFVFTKQIEIKSPLSAPLMLWRLFWFTSNEPDAEKSEIPGGDRTNIKTRDAAMRNAKISPKNNIDFFKSYLQNINF